MYVVIRNTHTLRFYPALSSLKHPVIYFTYYNINNSNTNRRADMLDSWLFFYQEHFCCWRSPNYCWPSMIMSPPQMEAHHFWVGPKGLLPDTQNCGLRMRRGNAGNVFPPPTSKETTSWLSRHASRHVRHDRGVMHVGIANPRWRGTRSRRMRNPQFYVSGKRRIRKKLIWRNFCENISVHRLSNCLPSCVYVYETFNSDIMMCMCA